MLARQGRTTKRPPPPAGALESRGRGSPGRSRSRPVRRRASGQRASLAGLDQTALESLRRACRKQYWPTSCSTSRASATTALSLRADASPRRSTWEAQHRLNNQNRRCLDRPRRQGHVDLGRLFRASSVARQTRHRPPPGPLTAAGRSRQRRKPNGGRFRCSTTPIRPRRPNLWRPTGSVGPNQEVKPWNRTS